MDEIRSEKAETETGPEQEVASVETGMSFKNKMMLVAVFGILLGFVIKTEAAKKVTVGFEDYKLLDAERLYDVNGLQNELEFQKKLQEEQAKEAEKKRLEAAQQEALSDAEKTTCDVGAGEQCE